MNHIWSPWRMKYILHHDPSAHCIFCQALSKQDDLENLVLQRGALAFVILNRYPYTTGHLMVVPTAHKPSLEDLSPEARAEVIELVSHAVSVLRKVYQPDGVNIGVNIGSAAGAGVADHVHFHVLPRWVGDTNFMSTVGETRVLPENLSDTYQRLRSAW